MKQIIECVPNISEGRDKEKIRAISSIVEEIDGVKLLNVDPGHATNRTVITFVGEPSKVIEADFLLTNRDQPRHIEFLVGKGLSTGSVAALGHGVPEDAMKIFLDGMEEEHGGVIEYLRNIGVDEKQQAAMRDALLED